jgi:N-carbamoyl-L-amino-acid hydrolase
MSLFINADRLYDSIMEIGKIGETEKGGSCRLALTDLDKQARDLLAAWCKKLGCKLIVDQMGNMFFRIKGKDNSLPPIGMGSHLDTQPSGGKYDGVFGVMSALEVLRTLHENNIQTESPIELINWTNEEGSRFAPCMIGSGVYTGKHSLEEGLNCKDNEGKLLGEELKRIGYSGDSMIKPNLKAYIEPHIEQGPILEDEQKSIGIVLGALGQKWYDLEITGLEAHAGPTPMHLRKDALLGAIKIIDAVNRIAQKYKPDGRGTVGELKIYPNSRNVIPGSVLMSIDIRHSQADILDFMEAELKEVILVVSDSMKLKMKLTNVTQFPNVNFNKICIDAVRQSADKLGYSHMNIVSGAGHDAVFVSDVVPTAMIFIPCKDGISHNEIEFASKEDIEKGCNILLHTILKLDKTEI